MQDTHDTREHLRGYFLVDPAVVVIVERCSRAKDMFSESINLVLIFLALIKALLSAVVKALLVAGHSLRHN